MKHIKGFNENLSSKLFLLQQDGGDQLYFTGVYSDLELFTNDMKAHISKSKNIDISEIEVKNEGIEAYAGSSKSDAIVFRYKNQSWIFFYEEITINNLNSYID